MQYIQLYVKKQGVVGFSAYTELDLYNDEPIKITDSIQDADPTANTSGFSRTFRVPNTPVNNKFFKAVFNVNSVDYDATQTADAYINVDGLFFISGNVRLESIIRNDSQGKVEYTLIFLGEIGNFGTIVGPKDLSQLDMSDYAHAITYTNITNSWNNNLFGGDIVYPLAEWGYDYNSTTNQPIQNTLSVYNGLTGAGGSTKGFTNSSFPLAINQWKPAIRVKAIWDKIFEQAGFTYESDFMGDIGQMNGSNNFLNLYTISTNTDTATLESSVDFSVIPTPSQTIPVNVPTKMLFNFLNFDDANAFDVVNSQYRVPVTGTYTFDLTIYLEYRSVSFFSNPQPVLSVYKNGVSITSKTCEVPATPSTGSVEIIEFASAYPVSFTVSATQGDIIEWYISCSSVRFDSSFPISITGGELANVGPALFDPSGLLPIQYKQLEFIKGINDRFKLMWEADPQNPKNFFIEPWNVWIKGGSQKDWTNKLNENEDIVITPLFNDYERQIKYRDSEEGDIYNFLYQEKIKETFGQLNTDSNITLIKGEKIVQSLFSAFPVAPIGLSDDFLIPHFAKDSENKREPILVKPRLAYYNGVQASPKTWYMVGATGTVTMNTYPLMSNFTQYPFDQNAVDISWTNVVQFWDPVAVGFNGRTNRSSYSEYWALWWDSIYNAYSRKMVATFALTVKDFQELRWNDKIFVKDTWWLPLKITDFVLGAKNNVKVEMLKLGNIGINIGGTGPTSGIKLYRQSSLCYNNESGCNACCCIGSTIVTVWTDNIDFAASSKVYADSSGVTFAAAGFYSDGTNFYEVTTGGLLIAIGVCSGCDCLGGLVQFDNVCFLDSPCAVCCCDTGEGTIYGTGGSISSSAFLYSSVTGDPLLPLGWYGSNGEAVQVGADGVTVIQVYNCAICEC